ncbi:MAG: hypothetical protein US86_C0001G0409 [Candidatus Daviesbacteria bacterium GW2011_GWA2_38_24]|uniref:Glycerophosphoryl diester phosphodiesterase membrane domain-containing protein n=1 Tax=Candidatus Daviesbacteria bacterium GW2011_GWA2_38_24 TaxID=1618422 RepID=A0A0G0JKT6_9BACT|nr:MAG: hypothetical protein US86_C0001G0409 [Candidatus Daviesbacteria bacterium GW2011_GWA2_38_24]KKQ78992.1 MAG: hypothetical protein UT01_C0053G0002 [Candidatus Daviesbacteria bacterium GW2011_GWA1_38_7]OGE22828.1 MAG: hypothetical protein A2688_02990 [Candidatus Daviesbacteria bacterium RIFCSPHIGHO2_01_FULL_38_8]
MNNSKFSIVEAFKFAWQTFISNPKVFLIYISVLTILAYIFNFFVDKSLNTEDAVISGIFLLAEILIFSAIHILLTKTSLDLYDKSKILLPSISSFPLVWLKYNVGVFIYLLIFMTGTVLFLVPGIYFGVKYQFVLFPIVEKNKGILEGFKISNQLTKGSMWKLVGFLILESILTIGSPILAPFIIPQVAFIFTTLASTYVYRQLQAHQTA